MFPPEVSQTASPLLQDYLKLATAGAACNALVRFFLHPLDCVKTTVQAEMGQDTGAAEGGGGRGEAGTGDGSDADWLSTVKGILKKGGVSELLRGIDVSTVTFLCFGSARCGAMRCFFVVAGSCWPAGWLVRSLVFACWVGGLFDILRAGRSIRHYFSGLSTGRITSREPCWVRGNRPRPVRFQGLLIRPDPTRPVPSRPVRLAARTDPTRLHPRGFDSLRIRPAGRVMTRVRPSGRVMTRVAFSSVYDVVGCI